MLNSRRLYAWLVESAGPLLALGWCETAAFADDAPPPCEAPPCEEPAPPADAPPPADRRDADIFGSSAPTVPAEAPAEAPVDAGLGIDFTPTTNQDIADKLQARDDTLTIGGQYYQRLDVALGDGVDVADTTSSAPTLLDLFVDSRPNDRVRLYARGRLDHDFTVKTLAEDDPTRAFVRGDRDRVAVDQLWTKFDVNRKVFVTVGQQRLKWGTGRFWNPTDFTARQTLDPLQSVVFDTRTGVGLVKLQVPLPKANTDLYAVGNFEGARNLTDIGGALRAEWVGGSTAISLSAAARKDNPLRLGADLSTGIGLFDFKVEAAVRHGDEVPSWEGTFDPATFELPTAVDRSDDWIPEVVGGVEFGARYNSEDVLYLGAEVFYNDAGYESSDLYAWLALNGQYRPFYLGKMYVGAYALLPAPGQWDDASFTGSFLSNLSDHTYVARLDYSQSALTFLRLAFNASYYFGEDGEFHYAFEIPEGTPGFEAGYTQPAPMVSVGAAATISF